MTQARHVTLFVSCIVDQIYPEIGMAAARLLQQQGIKVQVPAGLTCCCLLYTSRCV